MKNIVVLLCCCFLTAPLFSQTLFTYGPYGVGKDEFLRAYNKNKTQVTDKAQSLKEYLDLYTKFKLKIRTAQDQHLDTLQQLQYDLQNFRSQIAEGYMNDEKGVSALVDEALERSRKDIHLLHFYINTAPGMSAADSLQAIQAMNELADQLQQAKSGDTDMIAAISKKYTVVKKADLGYITSLSLPYAIENLVYRLKPGEVSKLYRTKSALHVFKNAGERKSPGNWKIAQILLSVPPNASAAESTMIAAKADSIYRVLKAGADFSALAKLLSEDKLTYLNGGEMDEFGTGKFELPFETSVFALEKDGDISTPIVTSYGYHIVKRLKQTDIPIDKSDEAFMNGLKQRVLQDSRVNDVRSGFLETVKLKTGYKRNLLVKDAELFRYADSVSVNKNIGNYPVNNKLICSFAKLKVKGSDWLNFVKDYKLNADVYKGENNKELLDKYISTTSFDYYRKHLDEYNSDFKYQLEEFREGNMLFEIMERNIWTKATNDSFGLQTFYNDHKSNYKWAESADILLFNCADTRVAEQAVTALRDGKNWRQIGDESDGKIQSDSGRYELAQMQFTPGTPITEGLVTAPFHNSGDNTSVFMKVLKMFPANEQRSFDEARGLVINDYQAFLEARWIEELKKKYPVKVNELVFNSLIK